MEQNQKQKPETKKVLSKEEKDKINQLYSKFIALKHTHVRDGAKPIGRKREDELKKLELEVNKLKGKKAKLSKTTSAGIGVELKTAEGAICPQHLIDEFFKEFKENYPKQGNEHAKKLMAKLFE